MPWTAPRTWANNELVDQTIMNAHVRDNLSYLLNPNNFSVRETTGTYTTVSLTAANVGANYSQTLVTNGGPVLIGCQGIVSNSANAATYLGLSINAGAFTLCTLSGNALVDYRGYFSFTYLLNTLAAGTHTIALQWYVAAASTATITKTVAPLLFWGIEL